MSTVKVNTISTWTGNDISIETGKTVSGTASQFKMTDVVQGDVLYGSAADTLSRLAPGTAGQVLQTQGAGANPVWAADAGGLFASYALLQDQKADGVAGGTFTSGAWQTRELQTEVYDGIGITISSNEFTLPAGSYLIKWSAPAFNVGLNQTRLYDVTGTASVAQGSSMSNAGPDYRSDTTPSTGLARVTPGSSNAYRIEHRCETTCATNGFGEPTSFGGELYTQIEIYKES